MTGFFVSEQIIRGFSRIVRALFDKVSEDIQDRGIIERYVIRVNIVCVYIFYLLLISQYSSL